MSDIKHGGHPFPLDERPLDRGQYPTDTPTVRPMAFTNGRPYEAYSIDDFALHASPSAHGYHPDDPRELPTYFGRGVFESQQQVGEGAHWWKILKRTPKFLEEKALRNTMTRFFSGTYVEHHGEFQNKSTLDSLIFMRPSFKELADYSRQCDNSGTVDPPQQMSRKQEEAILLIASMCSDLRYGPELLTRLINPVGVMGDARRLDVNKHGDKLINYNIGMNAYLSGLIELVALHYNALTNEPFIKKNKGRPNPNRFIGPYTDQYFGDRFYSPDYKTGDFTSPQLRDLFFRDIKGWRINEVARLIGLGARQWGFDRDDLSDQALKDRMERFYRFVFSAKAEQMLEKKPEYVCNEDVRETLKYPEYLASLKEKGVPVLQAEEALAEKVQVLSQRTDLFAEHKPTVDYAVSRVMNYRLSWEKSKALDYLLSDNGQGQRTVFCV